MEIKNPKWRTGYNLKLFTDPQSVENSSALFVTRYLGLRYMIPQSNNPERACEACYKENMRYVVAILTH